MQHALDVDRVERPLRERRRGIAGRGFRAEHRAQARAERVGRIVGAGLCRRCGGCCGTRRRQRAYAVGVFLHEIAGHAVDVLVLEEQRLRHVAEAAAQAFVERHDHHRIDPVVLQRRLRVDRGFGQFGDLADQPHQVRDHDRVQVDVGIDRRARGSGDDRGWRLDVGDSGRGSDRGGRRDAGSGHARGQRVGMTLDQVFGDAGQFLVLEEQRLRHVAVGPRQIVVKRDDHHRIDAVVFQRRFRIDLVHRQFGDRGQQFAQIARRDGQQRAGSGRTAGGVGLHRRRTRRAGGHGGSGRRQRGTRAAVSRERQLRRGLDRQLLDPHAHAALRVAQQQVEMRLIRLRIGRQLRRTPRVGQRLVAERAEDLDPAQTHRHADVGGREAAHAQTGAHGAVQQRGVQHEILGAHAGDRRQPQRAQRLVGAVMQRVEDLEALAENEAHRGESRADGRAVHARATAGDGSEVDPRSVVGRRGGGLLQRHRTVCVHLARAVLGFGVDLERQRVALGQQPDAHR